MSENLLRYEASPYLLQHRDNPVHWRAWGPEAFAEAAAANRPVLLSVGYAACHWCHVMAHESFENEATAAVMNRLFVNIKVDREERPDVDQIYMSALHALGERGGWPMTMFLTPAGEPIWGGTYFPPASRYGRPGFTDVLQEIARIFRDEPDKIAGNTRYVMERLAQPTRGTGPSMPPGPQLLDAASAQLLTVMDGTNGGTTGAPKFPNAALLECLWRAGLKHRDQPYPDAVLLTLRSICQGGIYDHIGGGFARYSTDARWLVPHFEKMLYDNAQLVELLTYAHVASGDRLFADRIAETVAWLEREMLTPEGAFAASLDADSEGHEGKFYVWTKAEVIETLGAEEAACFCKVYDIAGEGNFEGASIPNRLAHRERLSEAEEARVATARRQLLARRARRVRPATDDKILADWNGLMIAALALAGATFRRPEWIALAERAFSFVTTSMSRDSRLAHSWRAGKSVFPGLATDYAAMLKAALALHAATLEARYIAQAEWFAATARAHHWDADQPGYFLSAADAPALIIRPKATADEATPSATGVMIQNLVRLWRLTGKDHYRADADAILAANAAAMGENLFASTSLLNALDLRLRATDVVIIAPSGTNPAPLIAVTRGAWTPNLTLILLPDAADLPPAHPAHDKVAVGGKPTAYVCRGEICSLPVGDGARLRELLA